MTSKRRGGIQLSAYPFINFDIVLDVEFIFQQEIDEDVLNQLKSLIYTLGPPPIDIVIVGSEETKLEIEDVVVLKISTPLDRRRILKEVATAHAVTDPQLIDIWGTPPDIVDSLALELSIALFKRLVDTLVAKVDYKLVLERLLRGDRGRDSGLHSCKDICRGYIYKPCDGKSYRKEFETFDYYIYTSNLSAV